MNPQFYCTSIEDYGNQRAAIVRGSLLAGVVSQGMSLCIELGVAFEITVPIMKILDSGELLVDCDDQEGLNMLLAFNVANEYLQIDS